MYNPLDSWCFGGSGVSFCPWLIGLECLVKKTN